MIETFNWGQRFTFNGSNLADFFKELDYKLFHLITLSKNKQDFPHICNVYGTNLFLMWQSIYPEIRLNVIGKTVDSEDVYIIFLIIHYVSDYYVIYGDKKDNPFLIKSDELFKWYHSIFPRQSLYEKIGIVLELIQHHKSKNEWADKQNG